MMRKIILPILIMGSLIAVVLSGKDFGKRKMLEWRFGDNLNNMRIEYGLPIIENGWIIHDYDSSYAFWSSEFNRVITRDPHHLSKTTFFAKGNFLQEEDDFHYEGRDSIAYRVVYKFDFTNKQWSCRLITYWRGSYPPSQGMEITLNQADSILNIWGLTRTLN